LICSENPIPRLRTCVMVMTLVVLGSANVVAETPAEDPDGDKSKEDKPHEWVIAPIPVVEPNLGAGLGVVGIFLTPLNKKDEVSPKSIFGGGGFYTDNGSWAGALGGKLFISEDRFRVDGGFGYFDVNYDFFGVGNEAGDRGISVPIEQKGPGAAVGQLTRISGKWYLGPRYRYVSLDTRVDLSGLPLIGDRPNIPDEVQREMSSAFVGLELQRNTKNYEFNPTTGSLFDFRADFYEELFDNDFVLQRYTASYNHYLRLGDSDQQVIAVRGTACSVAGDAPFFELCMIGRDDAFRGYQTGRYRDASSATAQAEYRWQFLKRFGMVVFGGVAQVAEGFSSFDAENILPAGRLGFRWMAAVESRINVRVDYAWGDGDSALYIFVGEAF
jgi:outer membrane protein assembly factor BamA